MSKRITNARRPLFGRLNRPRAEPPYRDDPAAMRFTFLLGQIVPLPGCKGSPYGTFTLDQMVGITGWNRSTLRVYHEVVADIASGACRRAEHE